MDFSIPKLLYEEGFGVYLLVTVGLAGGAAWLMGRAIAGTWRPWWQVGIYALILAAACRFIHFALFGGTLVSGHYYLVDAVVCLILGTLAYRITRAGQMCAQYAWLNQRSGPMSWRQKTSDTALPARNSG